jgi:signal transduction histidine kinase
LTETKNKLIPARIDELVALNKQLQKRNIELQHELALVRLQYRSESQAWAARLLSIQESGNRILARELHDGLSQDLVALGMEVSTLLQFSGDPSEKLPERIRNVSSRITGLAEVVHAMSRRLHPAILDELGLAAALREECLNFSVQQGIPVKFNADGQTLLSQDVSLCLYRVGQESLRNIARHAKAASVRVALSMKKGGSILRIGDKGGGFDLNEVRGKGGLGLISMEERVRLINGKLTIKSEPGKGTLVRVFVPFKAK